MVVRVGDSTVIRCLLLPKEDLAICPVWTHYPPPYHRFSSTERELNRCDDAYDERFTLQTNTSVSILSITSIKPEDAGRYECQDDDQLGFSKEVIVIGKYTIITVNDSRCRSYFKFHQLFEFCSLARDSGA